MKIKILGAHNLESSSDRLVSLLVDDILAIDAGSITSGLSMDEQKRIQSILLSHHHFDHIRDIATFGLSNLLWGTKKLYATQGVHDVLAAHLINGVLFPKLTQVQSPEGPSLKPFIIEPYKQEIIDGYRVLAVPVKHGVPTVGFEVASNDGKVFFYSSDTTHGLADCWKHISPQLLIMETTLPDRAQSSAIEFGHLTPALLKKELAAFRDIKGYTPPHRNCSYHTSLRRRDTG